MKGLLYRGARDIEYADTPDPEPEDLRSAIVKVSACGICGSDLHIYEGHGFTEATGYCVGHEAVGEIVETGSAVSRFKSGDKVMISAAVGCGECRPCLAGVVTQCELSRARCFGLNPGLQIVCQQQRLILTHAFRNMRQSKIRRRHHRILRLHTLQTGIQPKTSRTA